MEGKSNKLVIIMAAIIVVLLVVIGVFVFKDLKSDDKKDDKTEKVVELNINDSLVVDADKILGHEMCGGYTLPIKTQKDIKLADLEEDTKLDMIYYHYMPTSIDNDVTYTMKDVSRYFEDTSFLDKDGTYNAGVGTIFKNGDKLTESVLPTGCEGAFEGITARVIKATKTDSKLELTYIVFYQTYDYETNKLAWYKKESDSKPLYDNVEFDDKGNITTKVDNALFNQYVITFDIKDDNVRFIEAIYKEA